MNVLRAIIAMWAATLSLPLQAQLVNAINAIVHDSVVTFREVELYAAPAAQQLGRQLGGTAALDREYGRLRGQALENLVERQLILHDYASSGLTLPETVIDNVVEDEISRAGGRTKLTKTLQAEGKTFEKFRQQIRDQFIVRVLRNKNVSQEIIISPHKIETYYLAHPDEFKLEDQIKLRMIVLNIPAEAEAPAVRQLAREILDKMKAGAAFSEMASVYSQGSQRQDGGDWGWIERKVLRTDLSEKAFALKAGEISDVIETDDACYLMLVEEKRTAHVKPLADVQDGIEQTLRAREQARLQKQYVDRLKKKTFVQYY